jgi:DNA-binding transcriptional ArsR family regulator
MKDGEVGDVRPIDDVRALTALADSDRGRLMDALAVHGASTTTALAAALGLASGSVSHHLKVLVEAGLVERAESDSTDRRQRWWRLVSRGMSWSAGQFRDDPLGATIVAAADNVMLDRQFQRARAFLESGREPWDDAAFSGQYWLRVSPEELAQLGRELDELLLDWRRREIPADGVDRTVVFAFTHAFPSQP